MAARENQGLQIALIIFVVLTIVLIVTTYMFFSSYSQERDKAKSLAEQKSSADTAAQQAVAEFDRIKTLIGAAQPDRIDAVEEAAKVDMATHGEGLVESKQNYRDLVKHMSAKLRKYEENNTKLAALTAELEGKLKTNEEAAKAAEANYVAELNKAGEDLKAERDKFGTDRTELTGQMQQLSGRIQTTAAEHEKVVQQSTAEIATLSTELKRSEELRERLLNKDAADKKANEYPDGKVVRVNQRTRLAYLNVGTADGLRNQTSFVVVAPEDGNPVKSKPKGMIEVVRLTGDHQAEARIVEDDLSNPIMPNDLIFSTVWEAGRAEHFALAGYMDIDQDGENDRQLIRDLITMNGGVIDAEVTADGSKNGEMSVQTKYLVQGARPTAESKDLEGYGAILTEAQKLGVPTISVNEFLDYMGYRGQEQTVNLGRNSVPSDFKPRLPGDVQRTVKGNELPKDVRKPRRIDRGQ